MHGYDVRRALHIPDGGRAHESHTGRLFITVVFATTNDARTKTVDGAPYALASPKPLGP